ncbi:OmpA family protein [Magnetovibrio sp. PR-2]|uniref:OmpA family protein n=1 Tax=Magnetovibrio sp. PR-2 TaxID=3120356 RepID=UPI002FCE091B
MKNVMKASALLGAMGMLAACASSYDVEGVKMMSDQGDAYASALHKRYSERAVFEKEEGDWQSVAFFNDNAKMAAMGQAPMLQDPSARALKADMDGIKMGHASLTKALGTNAPQVNSDACARAQTFLEHWMEQSEEGHQPDHIAAAKTSFETALPDCVGEKPVMAKPELKPLIVYFAFDSAEVSSGAMSQVKVAVEAAKKAGVKQATVIGHTDTSGNADYNMMLSQKRAEAVAKALMVQGIGTQISSSHAGETSPMEATDDGVKSRLNRRVEVVFK